MVALRTTIDEVHSKLADVHCLAQTSRHWKGVLEWGRLALPPPADGEHQPSD
jgi:hypothetical protein